ncbi:MAG: PspC domain-containing protein [Anaerolineales bacterium]|jgi:phage shock protein C|nr:PspC domain-containing protein [Anaerolineales bacterium]
MTNNNNQLYRSRDDRMIGGICAGLGEFFGIDPTIMRLIFVFGAIFFGFPGALVLIYFVMLLVVPEAPMQLVPSD